MDWEPGGRGGGGEPRGRGQAGHRGPGRRTGPYNPQDERQERGEGDKFA